MRDKMIPIVAYSIVLVMIGAIAFIFGLLCKEIETKVVYKDRLVPSQEKLVCPEISKQEVETKVVYKYKVITKVVTKTVYKDYPIVISPPEGSPHLGISAVGADLNGSSEIGLGVSVRENNYIGKIDILTNNNFIFSIGYEF